MLECDILNVWLRKQARSLSKEWVNGSQSLATIVELSNFARCNSHLIRVTVTQSSIVVLYVAKTLCLHIDILLQALHILLEIVLNFLELLRLELECEKCFAGVVRSLNDGLIEVYTARVHTILGLLQRNQGVVSCNILAEALLHNVDDIGTLGAVCTVECLSILMPLVEV